MVDAFGCARMLTVKWLRKDLDSPRHRSSMVCIPYAGGGPGVFRGWQRCATDMSIVGAHLPGREGRIGEPALTDISAIADQLADELVAGSGEYGLFGHSMGALVAFEVARRLVDRDADRLRVVFLAGCEAPPLRRWEPIAALPTPQLLDRLTELGGLPAEAMEFPELVELMLPTLRADLTIVDSYRVGAEPLLPFPFHVLYGTEDPQCDRAEALRWQRYTSQPLAVSAYPGGHFFPFDDPVPVLDLVTRELAARSTVR